MADNAKQQLLDDIKNKALNEYGLTNDEYTELEEKFYAAVQKEDWETAREGIHNLEEKKGWDLEEEKMFLEEIVDPGEVETVDDGSVDSKMPKREKLLLQRQIKNTEEDELLATTDLPVGVQQLFDVQEGLYRDTGKTAFIISNQQTWEGRVSVELSSTKKKFELMSVYEDGDGGLHFKHFGQKNPNKGFNKKDSLSKSFYKYKFIADDKEYLALSTEKLDTVRCKLRGTKVSLNDYETVGEFSKLAVDRDIIFVHSVDPAIQTLTDEQLFSIREDIDHDTLAEKLLGGWRQPKWFEKLLLADIMVNDENGYPSHLIGLSKPGTGKSKIVESALIAVDETQKEPFTGSGSTVKGLVPSFKESPPEEGYLLKTQRVAGVDEKMDLLSNSIKQGNDAANDVFRPLLNLLTHDTRTFESGNGSIKGQMMSTMWATGNFNAYGIKDMKQLAEKIDSAYLSRCIIYSYTQSHIEFINERKAKVKQMMQDEGLSEEDLFPETDDTFISLLDTMREDKPARIDFMEVNKIHRELLEAVPGYMREIFTQRGAHHMENITIGLAKYHYLVDDRDTLEAQDKDYEEMKKIFELIISGWDDVNMEELSFEARKEALTPPQRRVFNVIDEEPGVEASEIADEAEVEELAWCLTSLKRENLVAVGEEENGKRFYPYWSEEFAELTDEEVLYEE